MLPFVPPFILWLFLLSLHLLARRQVCVWQRLDRPRRTRSFRMFNPWPSRNISTSPRQDFPEELHRQLGSLEQFFVGPVKAFLRKDKHHKNLQMVSNGTESDIKSWIFSSIIPSKNIQIFAKNDIFYHFFLMMMVMKFHSQGKFLCPQKLKLKGLANNVQRNLKIIENEFRS